MSFSDRLFVALTWSAFGLAAALSTTPASAATLEVACTGTSAMMGLGSTTGHHVPDEMGKVLGAGFDVRNFGVQGTTAIKSIGSSYAATPQMSAALALNPDIVLFWFGGNDSFQGTWETHKGEFRADYTSLVRAFQALPTHPKTFLVRLWAFVDSPVRRTVLDREILPIIDQIAADTGSTLIDYRKAFEMHPEYFPDGMHPNDTGTLAIGKLFANAVTTALAAGGGADGGGNLDAAADAGGDGSGGASDGSGGGADRALPGSEDAAAVADAVATPATSGTGGSGAGAGGNSGTGSSGAGGGASGGTLSPAGGAGSANPPPAAAGDDGGCSVSGRGSAGGGGVAFLVLMGLCGMRRRYLA